MTSTDSFSAHRYAPPSPRSSAYHSGSDLLLRGVIVSYHHVDGGGHGTAAGVMAMPSGCSDRVSPVVASGRGVDTGLVMEMTGAPRDYQPSFHHLPQRYLQQLNYPPPSQPGAAGTGSGSAPKPIRRRMRMITSCLECRRRKLKCNKSNPCINCLKFSRDCLYLGPKLDEASQLRLTEIKEKVGSLERQLERDVAKSGSRAGFCQQRILADDVEEEFDEERDLEITPMVALDLTYEDDADGTDDIMDLGVQVGKMRLTEKIGGLNRPRISEEIQAGLSGNAPQLGSCPLGPGLPGFAAVPPSQFGPFCDAAGPDQPLPRFLRPSASYIPPTSGVFFGQVVQSPSLLSFLPTRLAGDRLLEHYYAAVHPIARCAHRPSLDAQYGGFWEEATAGYEPRASIQAVVFAAWFSAAVAMDENTINQEFGFTKANLVENMKIGTEVALSKANFLRTTRVETMQAFVMYMIPLCRDEVSRAHSVLVGAAVRMAECMGLNRDGSKTYNLNPLETHVRRLIWHQLCFLDIRTCEAQGPKPAIRREDYDTWLPENCEEDQLTNATHQPRPSESWTSTLLSLIRFEINEMMRIIWADRRKLDTRKITLTQVLTKVENFRKRMLESYDHLLDERVPIQRYAKLTMHLLMYRLHVMILHPYYANTSNPMPQRLRSVLIMSGIMIIELAMLLDTNPVFRLWRWYSGAYQQYQAALILATEMFYHPSHNERVRIWTCLDYVFELNRNTPTEEKGRHILREIMGKMGMYMGMRKMRAPYLTASASPATQAVKAEETLSRSGDSSGAGNATRPVASPTQKPFERTRPPMKNARPSMKEEPGILPPVPPGPLSVSSSSISGPGDMTALSPQQQQQQQQQMMPGPSTSSLALGSQPNTPAPTVIMSGVSNGETVWTMPPPPFPNANSPEGSSSDSGSSPSAASGIGRAPDMANPVCVEGRGMSGHMGADSLLDSDWQAQYQEDAINALFPYDAQTGTFTGFGDPVPAGSNNHSSWA